MAFYNNKKIKKHRSSSAICTFDLVGLILLVFGATTLCAFLLPIKLWVFFMGIVLFLCGLLLVLTC